MEAMLKRKRKCGGRQIAQIDASRFKITGNSWCLRDEMREEDENAKKKKLKNTLIRRCPNRP
jgi:hypothetical protein